MEIIQISLLILVFIVLAALMFLRKIPALIALPIMAFFIPIISGVSLDDTIQLVLGLGSTRLSEAYTIAIFGSMLSMMLQKTGVAESFIKKGAELSGDKPWTIALIMLILITLLFTTLGSLGAIIMVATVVLPIMSSVGISALTSTGIFLIGLSMGGILNAGNWVLYKEVLKVPIDTVKQFALIMFGVTFIISLVYITIQLYRDGHDINFKKIFIKSFVFLIIIALVGYLLNTYGGSLGYILTAAGIALKWFIGCSILLLFIISVYRLFVKKKNDETIYWTAYFIPLVPLLLILVFNVNFIASFICGLIYGFIATYRKNSLNILVRSMLEGGGIVMPAVVLMLGIGMLLNAVMGPSAPFNAKYAATGWPVLNLLQPIMSAIVPKSPISYLLFFSICAPLALYRGPLNVWGMGYGIAAIFLASGMNPGAIMGLLMAVGQIQGISDPTNTQNVWLANEMRVDVQKVLWNTIPYTWIAAIIGLAISAFMFM